MYLISSRDEKVGVQDLSRQNRFKSLIINLYLILVITIDLVFIKKKSFQQKSINLDGLYLTLGYFLLVQILGLYNFCNKKAQNWNFQEISIFNTFLWHFLFLFKAAIFGLCLSSLQPIIIPIYFFVRFSIYGLFFFVMVNHLRVIQNFLIKKGELKIIYNQYVLWQISNFKILFYAGMIGITLDLISFGNFVNYNMWLILGIVWLLYQFNQLMNSLDAWKYVKFIFQWQ